MMASISEQFVPGGWSDREVHIGHFTFKILTPNDPDQLLSHLQPQETAAHAHFADPYWAKLWPAAPLLAEALVRNTPSAGSHTLELGCGSGLVGITALALGLEVTFSDYVPLAVDLARENAARNGFSNAAGMILDWKRPSDQKFPLILAADVTYDQSNLDPLLDVLDRMLAPGGEAWLGDAGRSPCEDFVSRALTRGWKVSRYDENGRPATNFALGRFQRIVLARQQDIE